MEETGFQPQVEEREFRGRLGRRFALILLPLTIIPLIAMGVGAYLRSRDLLESQATSQMVSAVQAQLSVLEDWNAEREQRLQLGAQRAPLRDAGLIMLSATPGSERYRTAEEEVLAELTDLRSRQGQLLFSNLSLIRYSDGRVLASTDTGFEGQNAGFLARLPDMFNALNTEPVYGDELLSPESLALVHSIPVSTTSEGEPQLLLVGVNSGSRLGVLLEQMQIFWEQRGIYRVERGRTFVLLAPDIVIQLDRYATAPETMIGEVNPIFNLASTAPSGTAEYTNPAGDLVLAAYEWIPSWNMGIVAELPQADIFSEINSLAPFTAGLVAISLIATIIVVAFAANRMLRPLGNLTELAQRLSHGDWTFRVPDDRDDEIGALAYSLNSMAGELSDMYRSLEDHVEERTKQVRTAAEVARAVISTASLEDLMRRAVELIRQQFDYDFVSIFLLEEEGDFAVMREATGETGAALKAEGYLVPVGSASVIGWVTGNNQPRLVSDIQSEDTQRRRDLMGGTRSEFAIPLQTSGRVLGALDVQSRRMNAFRQQDVEALQTLADQLSAAILNARLAQVSAVAAERARLVSEVTTELSGPLEIEEVLERAARAIQRGLGSPEVMIKFNTEEGLPYTPLTESEN
ncbi:MAG: GAF domain-containing protein [Anaerolineales bacterium]